MADQAKRGVNPKDLMKEAATAGSSTVADLSKDFLKNYVYSKELDSARKYEIAFNTHINPKVEDRLAELLTREEAHAVMEAARVKRARAPGERGGAIGGVEAARTVMGVLRHIFHRGGGRSRDGVGTVRIIGIELGARAVLSSRGLRQWQPVRLGSTSADRNSRY
jgi:hypothetical protein